MLKRVVAILVACLMLFSTVEFATTYQSSMQTQTYNYLKTYMNRYEKTKFNAVAKLGNLNTYKSALMDVEIVVNSKMKTKALYDPDTNKLSLLTHPAKIAKTETLIYGENIWHELTHKIENTQDELGALEGKLYAERNAKYMAYVASNALPVLEKMEADKKADSAKIAKYWDLFVKKMDEANALAEVKQYPPDYATMQDWFGFKANMDEILKFYVNGSAGIPIKNVLASKIQTNWAGSWVTEFGAMTLTQVGNKISGKYEYGEGTLIGTTSGNKLSGTWKETDDEGVFAFIIAKDGQSFTGTWTETKPDPSQGGSWDGEKAAAGQAVNTQPAPQPQVEPQTKPLVDWSGTWQTDFGTMTLTQVGAKITGKYDHQDGIVSGTASGNVFSGIWKESDDEGTMTFTLAPDEQSFTGTWVETKPSPSQPSNWNGSRTQSAAAATPQPVAPVAPPVKPLVDWSGVWQTDFGAMTLTQNGDKITGKYESQEGVVSGTISDNSFTGLWKETDDEGTFNFVISADGKSFTGTWKETSPNPSSGGNWNGHK
jgi:hypothetical protein